MKQPVADRRTPFDCAWDPGQRLRQRANVIVVGRVPQHPTVRWEHPWIRFRIEMRLNPTTGRDDTWMTGRQAGVEQCTQAVGGSAAIRVESDPPQFVRAGYASFVPRGIVRNEE